MVSAVEIRLLRLTEADDCDNKHNTNHNRQLESNNRAIIESLELQLRKLRHR